MATNERQRNKICASQTCLQAGVPQPISNFYSWADTRRRRDNVITYTRYASLCKDCMSVKSKTERRQKYQQDIYYKWACSYLNGLQRTKAVVDPLVNADLLSALLRVQDYKCAVSGVAFVIPDTRTLERYGSYTDWRAALSEADLAKIPALTSVTDKQIITPGAMVFVINGLASLLEIVPIYRLSMLRFHSPTVYDYKTLLKEV